jgi:hypothetical protein
LIPWNKKFVLTGSFGSKELLGLADDATGDPQGFNSMAPKNKS